ncbi:MAG TPA: hypothetical protein VI136_22275 [Verrucomicrobiae bacterium]
MREDQHRFLTLLGQLPARLTAEQTAWALNCQPHDVPILVAARLLKPLGNPPPNTVKFFAATEVLEQAKDRAWLARVTNALNQHWQQKNAAKRKRTVGSLSERPVMVGDAVSGVGLN